MRTASWIHVVASLLVVLTMGAAPSFAADLDRLEDEFERAIKEVTPATVVCMPRDLDKNERPSMPSSGVIVSRKGLVLSDGDAGTFLIKSGKRVQAKRTDKIEIRIPNLKGKGFQAYEATVIHRNRDMDTSLIRIESKRTAFPYLKLGDSDSLQVGDFNFVMGNSFGLANEAPPTITAGIISALSPLEKSKNQGLYDTIYTSAAVNPGVNGGPIVDVDGRLIGTVGNAVGLSKRYQSLGYCVPIERLRAAYKNVPESADVFAEQRPSRSRSRLSSQLMTVFHMTARKAYAGVVSLDIRRKGKLSRIAPSGRGNVQVPRYEGPISGVLIDDKGHILTALYNLTNIITLTIPAWAPRAPYDAQVVAGIRAIQGIRVHFADGSSAPAHVTGYSAYHGIAMLKADMPTLPPGVHPLKPAPVDAFQAGRFVLALGNPYGANRPPDPLLSFGVLSKQHAATLTDPWAGQWQTDAGITDGNTGGAAVNLRGELIGILNMWSPLRHGRNSGIGFIAPWPQIQPHLEALKAGRKAPFLGIAWDEAPGDTGLILTTVGSTGAAGLGGLKAGDRVISIDGRTVKNMGDALAALRAHWAGDKIDVKVVRGDGEATCVVTLGARPDPENPDGDADQKEEDVEEQSGATKEDGKIDPKKADPKNDGGSSSRPPG